MSEYNKNKPLRVFEAFSGYGSQAMALDEIKKKHPGFEHQVLRMYQGGKVQNDS